MRRSNTLLVWAELDAHVKMVHIRELHQRNAQYVPECTCRVPNCNKSFKRAETFDAYDAHLFSAHDVVPEDYLTSELLHDTHLCLYPKCGLGPFDINEAEHYKAHLSSSHQLHQTTEQHIYTLGFIHADWFLIYYSPDLKARLQKVISDVDIRNSVNILDRTIEAYKKIRTLDAKFSRMNVNAPQWTDVPVFEPHHTTGIEVEGEDELQRRQHD